MGNSFRGGIAEFADGIDQHMTDCSNRNNCESRRGCYREKFQIHKST